MGADVARDDRRPDPGAGLPLGHRPVPERGRDLGTGPGVGAGEDRCGDPQRREGRAHPRDRVRRAAGVRQFHRDDRAVEFGRPRADPDRGGQGDGPAPAARRPAGHGYAVRPADGSPAARAATASAAAAARRRAGRRRRPSSRCRPCRGTTTGSASPNLAYYGTPIRRVRAEPAPATASTWSSRTRVPRHDQRDRRRTRRSSSTRTSRTCTRRCSPTGSTYADRNARSPGVGVLPRHAGDAVSRGQRVVGQPVNWFWGVYQRQRRRHGWTDLTARPRRAELQRRVRRRRAGDCGRLPGEVPRDQRRRCARGRRPGGRRAGVRRRGGRARQPDRVEDADAEAGRHRTG